MEARRIAGPRLRQRAINRTEQHIQDVKAGRVLIAGESFRSCFTVDEYIVEERLRLTVLRAGVEV